ncbi:MAG: TRAP transporter small permease [Castellaniella sp.]
MLRTVLNVMYRASGVLAAFFLLLICVLIVLQIVGRSINIIIDSTELAGFFLAASSFLGLAYTLNQGSHIRVNMLPASVKNPRHKAWLELWCCACAALVMGYITWQAGLFTLESLEYGDLSPGLMAVPFWIPQTAMTAGLLMLTIAFVDEFILIARGGTPSYVDQAASE